MIQRLAICLIHMFKILVKIDFPFGLTPQLAAKWSEAERWVIHFLNIYNFTILLINKVC